MTTPRERPILFSAPMVRAILAGTKSQTRRIVKPQPIMREGEPVWPADAKRPRGRGFEDCPYGAPGDRLWVRETWKPDPERMGKALYRASFGNYENGDRWRSPIHMRRWASRITLEITGVRVERLQAISKADAIAEGVEWNKCPTRQTQQSIDAQRAAHRIGMAAHYEAEIDYVDGYRHLWESINGPGSWDANPWVWVVEFRRVVWAVEFRMVTP